MNAYPRKMTKAVVALHISAILYFLTCLAVPPLLYLYADYLKEPVVRAMGVILVALCFVLGVGVEVVIRGLKRMNYWAWISAIITCAIYLSSIYLPLGVIGLVGLLNKETREAYAARR